MSIKLTRALADYGPATARRIGDNIPAALIERLTSAELGLVARLIEATYLDGYTAAGGDTCDTITHYESHRRRLCERA